MFALLEESNTKDAIVMIGRMNPPTAGHYKVIDAMKKYARENKMITEFFVVVVEGEETSKDKSKNPLSGEDRIKFMKASGKAVGVKFLIVKDAMHGFEKVQEAGYEPLIIAAGSDRADKYIELLDKYFPIERNGKTIKHKAVPGLDRKPSDTPSIDMDVNTISGSVARHVAKNGFFEEFVEISGLTKKPTLAKLLYDKVRKAILDYEKDKS